MTDVVVTVQGRASARVPAEQAIVRLAVQVDGGGRDEVMATVAHSAASVRDLVTGAGDAVASWSSDTARVWSERPWNQDGRQLDPVFHARVELVAVFTDADVLARLVDDAVRVDGVAVDGIEWSLSDESRLGALADMRTRAVTDATEKAVAYATALGLAHVHPLAIADQGMLDGSGSAVGQPIGVMRAAMASDSGGLAFTPKPIEIDVVVDARFAAS